jgi:hypothetical protein
MPIMGQCARAIRILLVFDLLGSIVPLDKVSYCYLPSTTAAGLLTLDGAPT